MLSLNSNTLHDYITIKSWTEFLNFLDEWLSLSFRFTVKQDWCLVCTPEPLRSVSDLLFRAWQSKFISCLVLWVIRMYFSSFRLLTKYEFYKRGPLNLLCLLNKKKKRQETVMEYKIIMPFAIIVLYQFGWYFKLQTLPTIFGHWEATSIST